MCNFTYIVLSTNKIAVFIKTLLMSGILTGICTIAFIPHKNPQGHSHFRPKESKAGKN